MDTIIKPVLFSGIQPSGNLMIGNYIGALKNWIKLQDDYDCLFAIVDLHAITIHQDPAYLKNRCLEFLCLYLACGINPEKSIIFTQSHVPGHAMLSWILNCHTHMGELSRMTQFKDKSAKHNSNVNVGLFDYPVLMAADILLYNTDLVPVGDDQKQHLELTRRIAGRFNNLYGDIFKIPEPYISEKSARIMSLQDPGSKMSKSDENANSYIAIRDDPDVIAKKLRLAVTDSGNQVRFDQEKPGISNLLTIYSAISEIPIHEIEQNYEGKGYSIFKNDIAETIIEFLKPIQQRYHELSKEHSYLENILTKGAQTADIKSEVVLKKVHDALGFIPKNTI